MTPRGAGTRDAAARDAAARDAETSLQDNPETGSSASVAVPRPADHHQEGDAAAADLVPADVAPSLASWDELAAAACRCTACPELAAARTNVVVGVNPPGARILLIGEAPGATEDAKGLPFVGASGRLLDRLLSEAGLVRSQVAVANILKCRPPNNRKPKKSEMDRCSPWIDRQLALIDPAVVCTLGGTALEWALGRNARIGTARGAEHEWRGRVLIPTYHPSAALRFGLDSPAMEALRDDLKLVEAAASRLRAESTR